MAAMLITYLYPNGSSAPSLAQMRKFNAMVLTLTTDAAGANEGATAIVHNMQLAPADGSDGRPEVQITKLTCGTALTDLSIAFTDLNTVTFTKIITGVNTAATFRVTIRRPNSIDR